MPPAASSYDEAETRFERWLSKYQSDRTAHERVRNAHPDPAALDARLAAAVRAMDWGRCFGQRNELALATDLLLSGARATIERFQDYELGGANLGDIVDELEVQAWRDPGGLPELGAFLNALTGSGSAAVLTNRRCIGQGGEVLPQFVLRSVTIGQPWEYLFPPRSSALGSTKDRAFRRVCFRSLARMAFLSAERTLGRGGTHPFGLLLGNPGRNGYWAGVRPLHDLYQPAWLEYRTNQAAALQVVYLMVFVYRAFPWPRGQHLADAEYIETLLSDDPWMARFFNTRATEMVTIVPGVFDVFLDQKLEHLLLVNGLFSHTTGRQEPSNPRGPVCVLNSFFRSRRHEGWLVAMLRGNRRCSAWVCKGGRSLLMEICRQRRRRVVQAIAQCAPVEFAAAAPGLVAFVRGRGVRGKKEKLLAWLESKLECPSPPLQYGLQVPLCDGSDPPVRGGRS